MKKAKTIYRVARTRQELEEAFSLVYKEYLTRGYIPKDYRSRLRISLYNALPSTTTFVAKQGKNVVAAVTLIPDSSLGLPMDKIYKKELDVLRKQNCKIAEVSQLAIDTSPFVKHSFSMFNFGKLIFIFRLFKALLDYALDIEHLTNLCIAINPKQQLLYKFLYFEPIGGLKYYASVNKAPAVALNLRLNEAEQKARSRMSLYKIFFGNKTDPKSLEGKFKLSPRDLECLFVEKSNIFEKLTPAQINILKASYPLQQIDRILSKVINNF